MERELITTFHLNRVGKGLGPFWNLGRGMEGRRHEDKKEEKGIEEQRELVLIDFPKHCKTTTVNDTDSYQQS